MLFGGDTEERPWHEQSWGEGLKSPTASSSRHGAPSRTAQASSKDNSSPKKTLPNLLCNYLYCTVFRYYIPPSLPSTHHRHLGPAAIKLKLFAFSDITITSASFGMCLTDLICASHLINSLRHLIFNLSALRLLCFFPSPFIPLLQAPQCTRSPQRQADQDICR